jgi:monofunctional glycosyltransferase
MAEDDDTYRWSDGKPEDLPPPETPKADTPKPSEPTEPPKEPPAPPPAPPAKKPFSWLRAITYGISAFFLFSIGSVAIHSVVPIPVTILMIDRSLQGAGIDYRWVPIRDISDELKAAVIASEDANFCRHDGFDFDAIKKAEKYNARHKKKKRGASTISQQTAKNAFLWPDRSWVRKGFEVYYTFLIETLWPKKRIQEVYLNVVEWGPGIYGAEAAAQYWFRKSAKNLTATEAARLAAILPNPRKYKASRSGPYVVKQSGKIKSRANVVENEGIDGCVVE